mgnify:CR=1 FL=1
MNFNVMDPDPITRVELAIEDIRAGRMVILIDDEDRENEGDFIAAAEMVTPEMVNFMATHGKGLICTPIPEKRCEELELDLMIGKNTSNFETPFTVSVDLIDDECTTGISAKDRAKTIKAISDPNLNPKKLGKPGHIFPLKAKNGGVLRRAGHTEASVDISKLSKLNPSAVICEVMNEDGRMARLNDLFKFSKKHKIKLASIEDLISYRLKYEKLVYRPGAYTFLDYTPQNFIVDRWGIHVVDLDSYGSHDFEERMKRWNETIKKYNIHI